MAYSDAIERPEDEAAADAYDRAQSIRDAFYALTNNLAESAVAEVAEFLRSNEIPMCVTGKYTPAECVAEVLQEMALELPDPDRAAEDERDWVVNQGQY